MNAKIEDRTIAEVSAVTGHAHRVDQPEDPDTVDVYDGPEGRNGARVIEARANSITVRHEEHMPINIPIPGGVGVFDTGIVQEFDHLAAQARNVID